MTIGFGSTMTPAEINGFISVFCHFYEHHEDFDYSDDVIEFDTCNLEILNGLYSDEELIVETPLKVKISEETFACQNYLLAVDYYAYAPDTDDVLPQLKREHFPLLLDDDNIAEIDFNDEDVVYVMLSNWELVTRFDKPVVAENGEFFQ